MGLFRQAAKKILTAGVSHRWLLTHGPQCGQGESPRLALTFDDGPHPIHTPVLLDTLRDCGLTGTFFVIGKHAERHPELIQRIADEGHEIGNHTWSHSEPSQTSYRDFLAEVEQTDALIEGLTGRIPSAVRPPLGELNLYKLSGLWQMKKTVVLWNIDPKDYRMRSADDICAWRCKYVPHDGDILLLHDNHSWANAAIRQLAAGHVFERFRSVGISTFDENPPLMTQAGRRGSRFEEAVAGGRLSERATNVVHASSGTCC